MHLFILYVCDGEGNAAVNVADAVAVFFIHFILGVFLLFSFLFVHKLE